MSYRDPNPEVRRLARRLLAQRHRAAQQTEVCVCGRPFDPRQKSFGCSTTCRERMLRGER